MNPRKTQSGRLRQGHGSSVGQDRKREASVELSGSATGGLPPEDSAGARVFAALEGLWTLQRKISESGSMQGTASFRRVNANMLQYREQGVLRLESGWTGEASREYFYVLEPGPDSPGIRIAFVTEGRPGGTLHRISLRTAPGALWPTIGQDVHLCDRDLYRGTYTFIDPDNHQTRVIVTGPAKNYIISTALTRIPVSR
jgi:hypothetical protein